MQNVFSLLFVYQTGVGLTGWMVCWLVGWLAGWFLDFVGRAPWSDSNCNMTNGNK